MFPCQCFFLQPGNQLEHQALSASSEINAREFSQICVMQQNLKGYFNLSNNFLVKKNKKLLLIYNQLLRFMKFIFKFLQKNLVLRQFVFHFLSFFFFGLNAEILLTEKLLHEVQKTERLKSTLLQKSSQPLQQKDKLPS